MIVHKQIKVEIEESSGANSYNIGDFFFSPSQTSEFK